MGPPNSRSSWLSQWSVTAEILTAFKYFEKLTCLLIANDVIILELTERLEMMASIVEGMGDRPALGDFLMV